MTVREDQMMARAAPAPKRVKLFSKKSPLIDVVQLILLFGGAIWLTLAGAQAMEYNWQWYRVPKYIYRIVDGEVIWGPLIWGLTVTLKMTAYSMVLTPCRSTSF